jgi:predicted nucleotidyltransferase
MLKMSEVNKMANDYDKVKDRLPLNTIFLGYRGSQAHGTFVPKSNPNSIDDIDLMGVCVGSIEHYFGFGGKDTKESFIDEYDIVSYELRKFVGLLLKNNPNVLSMLWLEPESILVTSPIWQRLVDNRLLFASKMAYHSFSGYAHAQVQKMTAFNQNEQERIKKLKEILIVNNVTFNEQNVPVLPAGANNNQIESVRQYNEIRSKYFSGYMGEKRKNNVLKYGYDTKNATHLIRLLRMAVEFLETGDFIVKRPDAKELLDIKQGRWTLEQVQKEAEKLFELTKIARDMSALPEQPDKEKIEQLLVDILYSHFLKF